MNDYYTDRGRLQQLVERTNPEAEEWNFEHRRSMQDDALKHFQAGAHA